MGRVGSKNSKLKIQNSNTAAANFKFQPLGSFGTEFRIEIWMKHSITRVIGVPTKNCICLVRER